LNSSSSATLRAVKALEEERIKCKDSNEKNRELIKMNENLKVKQIKLELELQRKIVTGLET